MTRCEIFDVTVKRGSPLMPREIGGWRLLDRVDVAGQQRGHAGRLVLDDPERDLLPVRLLAPVGVVARELDAIAVGVSNELVAAAADRRLARVEVLGRRAGRDLLRHDVDRRQVVGRERIRRRIAEADRVGIDDLLGDDRLRVRGERSRAVRDERHPVDRERDVLGSQLAAVVELDPLAQLELPRLVVDRLPRCRDARNHLRVRIHLHELVEDVLGDVVVREQVVEVRIDRRHVGRHRDLQLLAACRHGEERRHCNRHCGRETLDERTVHWTLESEPDKSAARCASRVESGVNGEAGVEVPCAISARRRPRNLARTRRCGKPRGRQSVDGHVSGGSPSSQPAHRSRGRSASVRSRWISTVELGRQIELRSNGSTVPFPGR